MITTLCYIIMYYNIDKILQSLYLPYIITNNNYEIISDHKELQFLLNMTSYFMLSLYSYILCNELLLSKTKDKNSIILSFIYVKYLRDILVSQNYTIIEYEMNRGTMWVFTTPIILKIFCDANMISVWDINIHYHLISIIPHIFVIPYKGQILYTLSTIVLSIPAIIFIKSLYKYKELPFTNLYILIWIIFMLINVLDITGLFSLDIINSLYNISDTVCQFICTIVISNYNEQELIIQDNMDLQSIKFVSHMIKNINNFEKNNNKLTPFCNDLIKYSKKKFIDRIPKSNEKLKLELLKKILPFDLDGDYIQSGTGSIAKTGTETGTGTGKNKEFNFICVMFMDIVDYTGLAKRYDGNTIFKLLDAVYDHFDTIIKKYSYLQKIETIGDAYMVVGDIYRHELNYKLVIKEIILLGLEFIKEIKNIKTPDNIPLCIRIGINIGKVNIGILGNEVPRLCVVGNTVNIASRLQSTADADTIQMSRHVYEHAQETNFEMKIKFIQKDNIFLKNIGTVVTYNIIPNDVLDNPNI